MRTVACLLVLALSSVATAGRAEEPDATERARLLFDEGRQLAGHRDYEGARRRFEAARAIKPMPELDYNVGFCWDKLGRGDEALREYRRYLAAMPAAFNAEVVRTRIAVLEQARDAAAANAAHAAAGSTSAASPDGAAVSTATSRRRYVVPIAVGAAALTTAIIGSALVGSVKPEFDRLKSECAGMCAASRWSGLEARANAGYALWGIAGAVAIADVVLWVVELRARREQKLAF
jgi:tetratricopeptide (TPR) repeat protein